MQLTRLKEWREAKGLMQKELAAAAGMSEFTVLRAERGDSMRPSTARKVAEAMSLTVADLMERPPVPLGEASDTGRLEGEQLEAAAPKDRQNWERVLASVHQRQRDLETTVEELVAAPGGADRARVKWALNEAQDCLHTLMLALPGSRRPRSLGSDKIMIDNLLAVDPDQWEEVGKAERFHEGIVERLVEGGLVEKRERPGQKPELRLVGARA